MNYAKWKKMLEDIEAHSVDLSAMRLRAQQNPLPFQTTIFDAHDHMEGLLSSLRRIVNASERSEIVRRSGS